MTASVYVNRDRTAIVPEGSPDAAYKVHVNDLRGMGLAQFAAVVTATLPDGTEYVARDGEDFATKTPPEVAVVTPPAKVKELPKPADKARRRPATK